MNGGRWGLSKAPVLMMPGERADFDRREVLRQPQPITAAKLAV